MQGTPHVAPALKATKASKRGLFHRVPHWPGLVMAIIVVGGSTALGPNIVHPAGATRSAVVVSAAAAPDAAPAVEIPPTTPATPLPVVTSTTETPTTTAPPVPTTLEVTTTVAPAATVPAGQGFTGPPVETGGAPAWLAGVPYAAQIDWVLRPGTQSCDGSQGAAWWPNMDTITYGGGVLLAESASNQVCVSTGAPNVADVARHEAGHWWQSKVIGVARIHADYGGGYPINSQADYQRWSAAVLEPLADCAALSWGATSVNYGCPAYLAHAYGL